MAESDWQPTQLDLDRQRELRITWADGGVSVIPLATLRKNCPCAGCRHEREARVAQPTTLPVIEASPRQAEMAIAADARVVGQYALAITWRDGHSTGIYDFKLLRSLADSETKT